MVLFLVCPPFASRSILCPVPSCATHTLLLSPPNPVRVHAMAVETAAAGAGGRRASAKGRGRPPRAGWRVIAEALSVAGVVSYARWTLYLAEKYSGIYDLEQLYLLSSHVPGNVNADDARRSSTKFPRVVAINQAIGNAEASPLDALSRQFSLSPPQEFDWNGSSVPEDAPWISPDWYDSNVPSDVKGYYDLNECEPADEDQFRSYPNCNSFHELDLSRLSLINKGGSRLAFAMPRPLAGGAEAKFCYKTARYSKDVNAMHVEEQRTDAWIMERTSRSRFITSVHGYCSLAIMMDFMEEGTCNSHNGQKSFCQSNPTNDIVTFNLELDRRHV